MANYLRIGVVILIFVALVQGDDQQEDANETVAAPHKGWYQTISRHFRKTNRIRRFVDLQDMWKITVENSKCIFSRIIPAPLKRLLPFGKNEEPETVEPEKDLTNRKEHGNLDFFGRDIARKIGKAIDTVEEKLGFKSSNVSGGLDSNKTFFSGVANKFKDHVKAIYPGTLWCGDGDIAKNFNDLGRFHLTDSCCREHDSCPDFIASGATKYDLENSGLFTRSNCECDQKFYDCLKKANTLVAKKIGFTYFSVLGPQCFLEDYPIESCVESEKGRCLSYYKNDSISKRYQWFDNPTF